MSEHLTTVTGRKLGQPDPTDPEKADHYLPEVVMATDYYPFGSKMPGRTYENTTLSGTNGYRYAFNGKELDKSGEWGSLNHYDYGFRIYNPAIAKFLSVDPLTKSYPWYTPYQFAGNKPIMAIDLDGLEEEYKFNAYTAAKEASNPALSQEETRSVYRKTLAAQKIFSNAPDEAIALGVGLGVVVGGGSAAVISYGWRSAFGWFAQQAVENAIETVTGIPVIVSPFDVIEKFAKKGSVKLVEKLKPYEAKRLAEYVTEGRKAEQIKRGANKSADFVIDGKIVEFKHLQKAEKVNHNTGVTKLQDATGKENVQILDLDIRNSNGSLDDAREIYKRFVGSKEGKAFKGEVKIATNQGLISF